MGWITEYDAKGNPVATYGDPHECGAYKDEVAFSQRLDAIAKNCKPNPYFARLDAIREENEREALYAPTGEKGL